MKRIYTSFEEIDKDLKVLKLQKEIHKEEIKLNYNGLKDDLGFLNVIGKTTGYIVKRALALKVMRKIFG
ncbi:MULTISPECIES: DUF6327 family protein [Galbibacter]|uniref:DUF6327 family protein n=1 Tax=Galbibacter pacificus TaxID=2996052 RepID=A0ABT6FWJ1_9FLAO|nr:DUF6327 family protein [Galbibacter pacificus]MDG3584178.1 DUF6327 family protein [Galbibacter pacificus]MDG3587641.1 DUF6327 family protein [Galbibacter pacificus]